MIEKVWGQPEITNTRVVGFNESIMAMRNPLDSWARSDSFYPGGQSLGDADISLSQRLSRAGTEHRKHLRFIRVYSNLKFPRYIWSEIDTYKYIDKISCSTMHTLSKRPLTIQDFMEESISLNTMLELNQLIEMIKKGNKDLFIILKRKLPEGFLQMRTISTNYETLLSMYLQRKNHRLPEWKIICNWILDLPNFIELTGMGLKSE